MKRRITMVTLISLVVMGMVLASCKSNEVMDKDAELETEAVVVTDETDGELESEELVISDAPEVFTSLDFEDGVIPGYVASEDATIEIIENVTGSKALQVNYSAADFPTVRFSAATPWDFGETNALSFEVTNPTDKVITFYLRVDDDFEADGSVHSTVSTVVSQPGATEKFFFSLSSEALDYGMRNLPSTDAGNQLGYGWGETSLDATNIVQFQLWQMYVTEASSLIFDDIQIVADPNADLSSMDGLVDSYGQYTGVDWDGKAATDQDLVDDKNAEAGLFGTADNLNTSKYGGWADGPKLKATGYYRVEQYNEKWTLVDPEGYLYFATGLDIARLADGSTWISGRENMFVDLPTQEGELADHYDYTTYTARSPLGQSEGWLFNFYSANLERKYGEDYAMEWRDVSVKRFKEWGFSSIGNWAEPELFFGKGDETEMPYVANGWSNGTHATIPSGNQFWAPVADPFDPEFKNSVDTMIADQILAYGVAGDEWCMGVYIDNEQAWGDPSDTERKYALIKSIFEMDARTETSYAKRAMIEVLKNTYSEDIALLNRQWGTDFETFEGLEAPYTTAAITGEIEPDYSAMLYLLAKEYFSIVDSALEKTLPNTLYLGSRFAEWGTSAEVQRAAAEYVDVVSFNVYKEDVVGESWMKLEDLDMPVIIGEFHFGSTDRGMFGGGLVNATDQANRGEKYVQYMNTVAQSPYFVGAHWFQYYDQPLIGRAWDGENYNVGFVDVADVPYEGLVSSAKEIHSKVYDIKFNDLDINAEAKANMKQEVISFEDGEDLSLMDGYKDTATTIVENSATDGDKALDVNVGSLDADYSGLFFKPSAPWELGLVPSITVDVTNPNDQMIQVRCNVADSEAQIRTFYFPVAAGETRTIEMNNFGASPDVWDPDGFWGANDGLKTDSIAQLDFYLWEDADFETANNFILDHLTITVK